EPAARLGDAGLLQVNLNWSARAEADVDLCVLAEFTDGTLQVVQALGDAFGRLDAWPYIALDHDDRSGAGADGETLRVNLGHHHLFRRLLFFTYLYEGSVSFRELGASVTVSGTAGTFRILLDDAPATAAGCAVALTESDGAGLTVRREVRWFDGHPELGFHQLVDQAYGFGLSWTRMDKPPRLG
ncbi:tellurium resistance protein TerA, partial [Streptomyces albidoflavus]